MSAAADPHAGGRLLRAGAPLASAAGAVILLHGRGGSAEDILSLASAFGRADLAYLAPEAAGRSWYPQSFLAPRTANEPYLSSALARIAAVIGETGVAPERVVLRGSRRALVCLRSLWLRNRPGMGGCWRLRVG